MKCWYLLHQSLLHINKCCICLDFVSPLLCNLSVYSSVVNIYGLGLQCVGSPSGISRLIIYLVQMLGQDACLFRYKYLIIYIACYCGPQSVIAFLLANESTGSKSFCFVSNDLAVWGTKILVMLFSAQPYRASAHWDR
jgi:hypothetical protein